MHLDCKERQIVHLVDKRFLIMKNTFKKLISVLGQAAVAALGFAGCEVLPMVEEYGTPNSTFKLDLTVTDESGNALKGIRVIPAKGEYYGLDNSGFNLEQGKDTLITDATGKAGRTYRVMEVPAKLKVYFEDPDGESNGGSFARDSAEFLSVKTGDGDKRWYTGEWTASGTKKLKKE